MLADSNGEVDVEGGAGGVLRPWSREEEVEAAVGNCGDGTVSKLGEGGSMVSIRSCRRRKGGVEKGKVERRREVALVEEDGERSSKDDWAVVAEDVDAEVSV